MVQLARRGELLHAGLRHVRGHERPSFASPDIHCLENPAFLFDSFPGGDHIDRFVEALRRFGNEFTFFDQLGDATLNPIGGHTLLPEIDCRFDDIGLAEDRLPLAEDTDRARGRILSARRRRRSGELAEPGVDQRIFGTLQIINQPTARFADGGVDRAYPAFDRGCSLLRLGEGHRVDLIAIIAIFACFSPPPFGEFGAIAGVHFRVAGALRDRPAPFGAMNAERLGLRLDVVAALGKAVERLFVDTLAIRAQNLEGSVLAGKLGFIPQAFELFAQDRVGHRTERSAGSVHRAIVPGSPPVIADDLTRFRIDAVALAESFGQASEVGNDGMNMTLRIGGAARVMLKECVDKIAGSDRNIFAADMNAGFCEILFCPSHGFLHGLKVRRQNSGVARDEREERRGLWH